MIKTSAGPASAIRDALLSRRVFAPHRLRSRIAVRQRKGFRQSPPDAGGLDHGRLAGQRDRFIAERCSRHTRADRRLGADAGRGQICFVILV